MERVVEHLEEVIEFAGFERQHKGSEDQVEEHHGEVGGRNAGGVRVMGVELVVGQDLLEIEASRVLVKDSVGVGKNSD